MIKILIVVGPEVGNEYEAIRQSLEYFGLSVNLLKIGRPNDFIKVLKGNFPNQVDHLILCFHGEKDKFILPRLHSSIYEKGKPKGDFGHQEIEEYGNFQGKVVLTTACGLGTKKMATAFINKKAKAYIAPLEEIEGNASLLFTIRFYYELIKQETSLEEAFNKAMEIDNETKLMHYFTAQKH